MRRSEREMPREFGLSVADKCEYAVLSTVDENGNPYCVPLTIVRENDVIYFHSARKGFKNDCFRRKNEVCIVCVGNTNRPADSFTTGYESAIIRGKISEVNDDAQRIRILRLLCERHTPANMGKFENSIKKHLAATAVWSVKINDITAKANQLK